MSDNFCIGFGAELVALLAELLLEGEVVFDDSVLNDDDLARAVAVRVGVLLSRAPVGGPAGVADDVGSIQGSDTDELLKVAQLAFDTANLQPFTGDGMPAES